MVARSAEVADQALAAITAGLAPHGLSLGAAKLARLYWNGSGRTPPVPGWRGTRVVPFCGLDVAYAGGDRIKVPKRRALVAALERRLRGAARALPAEATAVERATVLAGAARALLDPRSPLALPTLPAFVQATSDRAELDLIDRRLATLVVALATGESGARGFRRLRWRTLRDARAAVAAAPARRRAQGRRSMTGAAAFWARALARQRRRPRLGAAVLGGGWLRYALHRLRGFALVRGAAIAAHVVEVLVLVRIASLGAAVMGFVVSNLASLLVAAWWGATEPLREQARTPRLAGELEVATGHAQWWARRLAALAIVVGALGAAALSTTPMVAAYVGFVALRLAVDVLLRPRHAAVAGRGRVYRTPWAQVVVELGGAAALLAAGAVPVMVFAVLVLGAAASRWVTWASIVAAWRRARLGPVVVRRGPLSGSPWAPGLAGLAMRAPTALAMVALLSPQFPPHVAVGMHVAFGVLAAATTWTFTHYHDLIAVAVPGLGRLQRRVERALFVEAVLLGAIVGGLAFAVIALASPPPPPIDAGPDVFVFIAPARPPAWPFGLALPPLAVALSLLAVVQLVAWCRRAYGWVIVVGVAVIVAAAAIPRGSAWAATLAAAPAAIANVRAYQLTLAAAVVVAALILGVAMRRRRPPPPRGRVPWLTAGLDARRDPDGVVVLTLARGGDVAERIGRALAPR
ncbi:MAG: hypothetical protein R2939_17660 [Kofleriaceae bacterium]